MWRESNTSHRQENSLYSIPWPYSSIYCCLLQKRYIIVHHLTFTVSVINIKPPHPFPTYMLWTPVLLYLPYTSSLQNSVFPLPTSKSTEFSGGVMLWKCRISSGNKRNRIWAWNSPPAAVPPPPPASPPQSWRPRTWPQLWPPPISPAGRDRQGSNITKVHMMLSFKGV